MTKNFLRLLAVTILATAATSLPAAIAPAENLLPADTLAFFTIPDTAALRTASKVSPQLMCWNDPAMKAFHDKFMAKLTETYLAPIEKDLGLKIADFLDLPQGQLTVGLTVNGSNGHDEVPPGIVVLLDAKGKSDSLKTNLAALTKKWTDAGRALRTEKIHGLAFTVVPLSSNDFAGIFPKRAPVLELGKEEKPAKPVEIFFTQFESLLVVGNSTTVIEPIASRLTGGSAPIIADDAVFAADKLAQFRDNPTYYGWFNGNKFITLLTEAPTDETEAPAMMPKFSAAKILGITGLGGLKSATFALRESRDGSALTMHLTAPESTRAGVLKILALAPKDASAPTFVPADAIKYSRFRLDGKQTWAELQKMIAGISPQGLASLNAVIEMANGLAQQKNPGFDLRNALFNNLGDDIITYQKAPTGDTLAALSSPPTIYLIAVAKPDSAIDAIQTLAGLAQPQAKSEPRDFLGKKIYSIALRATAKGVSPGSLYVSASGGYLALSMDSAMLEEYLRSADKPPKPLRDNPSLMAAASQVGGASGGLFGYQNQREVMRTSFKLLKNSLEADTALKMFPPALREWADFSLLPDFEKVQKYFYLSVFSGTANGEGLTLKVHTPRQPQLP
jgi:hypothetical protein